ncbi:bacteriophage abortive infection AbiH family protein [Maribacter litopenaei]|uniref:Bacteriophage abortive infection AbiH family protein n=1 Tax=Maribacter litopenaei TaxID=2976127 RepID=A0ABY5Y6W9_9FLAO|nr:bacteriophage abortive infection AbiH family protein [Maribacter litopenaei]UWX53900.1 bacteriophage abortive infection AbiH family protein [Maribacter litopenaei]
MSEYNRIVLIGNGFDRACGLKTSYKNFIDAYIKNAVGFFLSEHTYDSELISIKSGNTNYREPFNEVIEALEKKESAKDALKFIEKVSVINYKHRFFEEIIKTSNERWVDIEQYYFDKLLSIYELSGPLNPFKRKLGLIKELNWLMDILTSKLQDYISVIDYNANISYANSPLSSLIEKAQSKLSHEISGLISRHNRKDDPTEVIFLNFNYTNTARVLTNNSFIKRDIKHINIHGQVDNLNNPIIFGYGDDTNESYRKLEFEDNNELIRKIKSFQYPVTRNYHHLLNILDSKEFDVFIIGHSCGLSDRTLLKTIFEHKNCLAIQNFHYKGEEDDFNKRMQISRHFSDKVLMRERVLPFDIQATIPQTK